MKTVKLDRFDKFYENSKKLFLKFNYFVPFLCFKFEKKIKKIKNKKKLFIFLFTKYLNLNILKF